MDFALLRHGKLVTFRIFTVIALCSTRSNIFCRHTYNLTGLCNRSTCPLANSRYATVREFHGKNTFSLDCFVKWLTYNTPYYTGKVFLCMKTIERAHQPAKMWEKIQLSNSYETALEQVCLIY